MSEPARPILKCWHDGCLHCAITRFAECRTCAYRPRIGPRQLNPRDVVWYDGITLDEALATMGDPPT